MSSSLIVLYAVLLIISFSIFLFNLMSLSAKKKSVGEIKAQRSLFFNLTFWINRFVLTAFSAYFLWCVYQIVSAPESSNGYHRLMILVFVLSFTPRWNVYIGSDGILFRMKFIPWENVVEKKIVYRGKNRCLEIKGTLSSRPAKLETMRIPIPKRISFKGCMKITL